MASDKPNPNRQPRPASVKGAPQITSASTWKKKITEGTPLLVPSGNTCLVQTPGLQTFIKAGMVPNSLMPIINEAMSKGKPPSQEDFDLEKNPDMMTEIMTLMDEVVIYCVLDPEVNPVPTDGEGNEIPFRQRDPDTLYVDEVDFTDKTFIFQYVVGGTADLERFRQELGEHMEAISGS